MPSLRRSNYVGCGLIYHLCHRRRHIFFENTRNGETELNPECKDLREFSFRLIHFEPEKSDSNKIGLPFFDNPTL